ncbi:MAG: sxtJ [Proteobacteria bacterium]|nr:MAG: sxtJ [Pseudomonadota bacterium]
MSNDSRKTEFTPKALRDFGLIMAGMLVLMFGIVLPWLFSYATPYWPFIVALGFVATSLLKPNLLGPVNHVWLKISEVLGWINTRLIMGIIFFLLIMPIGLIMRLFAKDPLNKQWSESQKSYRILTKVRNKDHLEKPF